MADEKLQPLGTVTPIKKKEEPELAPIQNKSVDKYQIRDIPTMKQENANLVKDISSDKYSTPAEIALQRKMNRRDVASARDTNLVVDSANRSGVNLNEDYSYPVTEDKKKSIAEGLSASVKGENMDAFLKYAGTHPNPNYITPPTLNIEEEKRKARRERAAKWADALYAFGEGMQGRTANKDNMASTIMQRKRDELFQNYKTTSEANKQTAKNWEYNYRKDLMDWIGKQQESDKLSAAEKKEYVFKYKQLEQQQKQAEAELGLRGKQLAADQDQAEAELGLRGKQLGLDARKVAAMEREQKERLGDENISFQMGDGKTVTQKIPIPEQRDIISRAKMNPKFLEYAKNYMNQRPVITFDADGNKVTQFVDEMGKNISDRDLLQAYLRWSSQGVPYENVASPKVGETVPVGTEPTYNENANQQPANNQKQLMDNFFSK